MRLNTLKAIIKTATRGAAVLLFGISLAQAQTTVNLTAGSATANLPDGSSVPMWGYSCGTTTAGTCTALKPNGGAGSWSPVIITVPIASGASTGSLSITLTNSLPAPVPTSLTIVGQLGGGLGSGGTVSTPPLHDNQGSTWPINDNGTVFTPPAQAKRTVSFGTEVAAGTTSAQPLTWTALRPGTYLLESGTHPSIQGPMGLYGIVVVTAPATSGAVASGTAYPGVNYSAEVPMLFSEIDPVLNNGIIKAVSTTGFNESATTGVWEAGPVSSIQVNSGGAGYTSAPAVTFVGTPGPAGAASATANIDTDPASSTFGQVTSIDIVNQGGYPSAPMVSIAAPPCTPSLTCVKATAVAALQLQANSASHCSNNAKACYPSVVNYTPLYYLINGVAFDKTNPSTSVFALTPAPPTGTPTSGDVLVRLVNAGVRMHVPSIVGSQPSKVLNAGNTVGGFTLVAEDGNPLPGKPRIQNEVFMAAGKTYDVMINTPAGTTALPIFDRELSLSGNSVARDSGMLAYISANGGIAPAMPATATANPDTYTSVLSGQPLFISDPSKGVLGNDVNVFGAKVIAGPASGTLALNANGTFTYTPGSGTFVSDSFTYCGNGATSGAACATVTLGAAPIEAATGIVCSNLSYTSSSAKVLTINHPGVLAGCTDAAGYPLIVNLASIKPTSSSTGLTITGDVQGGFSANVPSSGPYSFTFQPQNTQGTLGAAVTVSLNFPQPSGLKVTVLDGGDKSTQITDYRWIIEEDRTFFVNPNCSQNPLPAGCPTVSTTVSSKGANGVVTQVPQQVAPNFGTNFHTSFMPMIATGCTGPVSCGKDQTVGGAAASQSTPSSPADVALCPTTQTVPPTTNCLDPNKRYYVSVLPGDAAQPFIAGYAGAPDNCAAVATSSGPADTCGHGMGGAPIPLVFASGAAPNAPSSHASQAITVYTEPSPYPPATLSAFVFEDDYPLNGEHDAGGGVDVLSPDEPGLGGFQLTLSDNAGGTGDSTGTPTYDMFNMPLSNSLAGTPDPANGGQDACPITTSGTTNPGITGMIITCPKYEADGVTLSPLAGQAVIKNLYPGRYSVTAIAGADRIARGEEWLQTNTLDGQHAHDSFMRIGEPGYFQEFGPAGYHVTIGFANPKIINDRGVTMCAVAGSDCTHEVKGHITTGRMSRTPDERLYGSGNHAAFAFTQCYISLGDPDGADFAFTKCDEEGNFDFKNVPPGNWKITTFDQWDDQVVDGITTPVSMCSSGSPIPGNTPPFAGCTGTDGKGNVDMGEVAVHQWQADIYTRSFIDTNFSGVSEHDTTGVPCTGNLAPPACNANFGADTKPGLALVKTNIRYRDGSYSNRNNTDLNGYATFNEVFPLFNWYVIETDSTRFKNTGTHVVYDAGGPTDNTQPGGQPCFGNANSTSKPCGNSMIAANLANTFEPNPLPTDLYIPGSIYCTEGADCSNSAIRTGPPTAPAVSTSTGRIDAGWVNTYGWQGFSGQANFLEFGKKPYAPGENGGIHGHVVYASTRPFDNPQVLVQNVWEPQVPHVRINLYKEGLAPDGVTTTLTMVDHTETSSFDDWAQGFRQDANGNFVKGTDGKFIPNMSCPGQGSDSSTTSSLQDPYFFAALKDQPQYLDLYNNNGTATHPISHDAQFKCYDGMHNWNQLQPAPYDGAYSFPSVTSIDPVSGKPTGTNCTGCTANPTVATGDPAAANYDPYRAGTPMLPDGKYVVEVVVPPGYRLVKEEDKNILIGDNFIAPVTQQFGGLGGVFILPDQASVGDAYNPNNPQNPTYSLGRDPALVSHEGDTAMDETFWPCVGEMRIVPDFISLFPASKEVAPFAGAMRPLCDRKEVALTDQTSALAKFYVFTETHAAAHFTGVITDDFSAEFDPYSPQFGEKFAPAYLPVSIKDWAGNEINRVYSDAWGSYNGLNYSTWEVNPPNPTGYAPTMMVTCMNDPGPLVSGGTSTVDPLFQSGYSNFCYELPYMPGQTGYFDTPVVPTSAFAGDYNTPDCAYPNNTPAIAEVDGDGIGPWISAAKGSVSGFTLTGGSNYTTAPNVSIGAAPGGGTTATAIAQINGHVTTVKVNVAGSYPTGTALTATFTAPPVGGVNATGTVVTTTAGAGKIKVASITVTNPGSGYLVAPTVSITRGATNLTSATATASIAGPVSAILLTNEGTGYTAAPNVSLTGGGGSGASAIAQLSTSGTLTITALGDQLVDNYNYSGPTASGKPYNQQKITRHYGFGNCTSVDPSSATCKVAQSVLIGGQTATINSWSDTTIKVTVPGNVPACSVQQQALYGGSNALCGELVITAGSGAQSIDTVTVTVGGKAPVHVDAGSKIQTAIDMAEPGDLIIIDPTCAPTAGGAATSCSSSALHAATPTQKASNAAHAEMLIMWKPVRLQGVGAASSVVDANPHPAGKLDPWRRQIVCLFGLSLNGVPVTPTNAYDSSNTFSCNQNMQFAVDRLPLEATVGWDATLNGNLAEQLIEPTIMGAYEGAGITVLGKGVKFPAGSNPFASDVFPTGTLLLTKSDCGNSAGNPYPSNFLCNPSAIDGLMIKNSSQGGGGILLHGWNHNVQIANNRVINNQGTLSGGITIGQGEHPDAFLVGAGNVNTVPGSCVADGNLAANQALPYCNNMDVNVHNNQVIQNSSLGDELFSSTPAGAGGVTFCNGSDYYKFQYNWVCGNMSTGDGAGVAHIGLSWYGDIEHNSIMFNQSTNPTIVTNGGGLLIMGAPDVDPTTCGVVTDQDCVAPPGTILPSDGTGPGLVINGNFIVGNSADSGSGGGLRMQHINGTEVLNFPNGNRTTTWPAIPGHSVPPLAAFQSKTAWNGISVTNNIIANNVAGIDGGGVSMVDAFAVDFINNTVLSNNSTASSGVLLQTLFAPLASSQGTNCTTNNGSQSCPQIAGLASVTNSAVLSANIGLLPGGYKSVKCPANHDTTAGGACAGTATTPGYSLPEMYNDLFWQNRTMAIGVAPPTAGATSLQNQQSTVTVVNPVFGSAAIPAASQKSTGACDDPNAHYWDIGVRGDTQPGNHAGGILSPTYSVLTSATEIGGGTNNVTAPSSLVTSAYCDGARVPIEAVLAGLAPAGGWQTPPGTNENNALPLPPFTLQAAAVVDEGNNWINLRWGPLSLNVPDPNGNNLFTFDPSLVGTSPAVNHVPSSAGLPYTNAPSVDFYGNARKTNNAVDVGAIEFQPPAYAIVSVSPTTLTFPSTNDGATSASQPLTLNNSGGAPFTIGALAFPTGFARAAAGGSCAGVLNAGTTCTINVVFTPAATASGTVTGSLPITGSVPVTGSPVTLTGTAAPTTRSASVTPSPLAFGNVFRTSTATLNLTVSNTGNTALAGGAFTLTGSNTFSRTGGTCTANLAVGASCTIAIRFAPVAATAAVSGSLAVTYTGATVTGAPVTITGTGVATRGTVAITSTPSPFSITLPRGTLTGSGTVTLTNNSPVNGGTSVTVNSATVSGAGLIWSFSAGTDGCSGTLLAPGASCSVAVNFTRLLSAGTHTGTITFVDSASNGTPVGTQTLTLTAIAQ